MFSRPAFRAISTGSRAARRGFQTTRPQLASPYHYPEGPLSNLPFNPKTRFFAFRYWGSIATAFATPFGIAYWQLHKNV